MEIKYEVKETCGVVSEDNNYELRLQKISWNGKPAKYDLRRWKKEDDSMTKGITLSDEELKSLYEKLEELFEEEN